MRMPPNSSVFRMWALRCGALLAGVGCLFVLFRIESDWIGLLAHTAHAVATVEDTKGEGRQEDYLIAFTTSDGTPETLWTEAIDQGTRVGDRVSITYDALRVDNLREGDHVYALSVVPPALLFLAVAAVLFWQAAAGFTAGPTGTAGRIPNLPVPSSARRSVSVPAARHPSLSEKKRRRRTRRAR